MRLYYTTPVPYAKPSSPGPITKYGTLAYGEYVPPVVTPAVISGGAVGRLGLGLLMVILLGGNHGKS